MEEWSPIVKNALGPVFLVLFQRKPYLRTLIQPDSFKPQQHYTISNTVKVNKNQWIPFMFVGKKPEHDEVCTRLQKWMIKAGAMFLINNRNFCKIVDDSDCLVFVLTFFVFHIVYFFFFSTADQMKLNVSLFVLQETCWDRLWIHLDDQKWTWDCRSRGISLKALWFSELQHNWSVFLLIVGKQLQFSQALKKSGKLRNKVILFSHRSVQGGSKRFRHIQIDFHFPF